MVSVVERRRIDKRKLLGFVKRNTGLEIKRVLALFSLEIGYRTPTVQAMLNELQDAGLIELKNGLVFATQEGVDNREETKEAM